MLHLSRWSYYFFLAHLRNTSADSHMVFQCIRDDNLKLSPKKYALFMDKVKYVGQIVSKNGIEPDPDKIEKVLNWPRPTKPDEVRQFIGFVGYYSRLIKNFTRIAKPLNQLMPPTTQKSRKTPRHHLTGNWENNRRKLSKRKRKRSDSVLWQKPLNQQKCLRFL